MKLITTGADLRAATGWINKIVSNRPQTPAVGGVLLDAGEQLRLSATDYNVYGTVTPSAGVIEPGRALISARLLDSIADVLRPAAEVTITRAGPKVELKSGRSTWRLPLMDAALWPTWPDAGEPIGTVQAEVLRSALTGVLPAVSADESLRILTGVLLELGETLTVTATDRYRVASSVSTWAPGPGEQRKIIVPGEIARSILGVLGAGDVQLRSDGNTVTLRTATHQISGALLAGDFVAYERLLNEPSENAATVATFETDELTSGINEVGAIIKDRDAEPLRLAFDADGLKIARAATEDEEADSPVDHRAWSGAPIVIGVRCKWMRDALAGVGSKFVTLTFTGNPNRGFLLCPSGADGKIEPGYRHVLMTQRLAAAKAAA